MGVLLRNCCYCGGGRMALNCIAAAAGPLGHRVLLACNGCHQPYAAVMVSKGPHAGNPLQDVGDLELNYMIAFVTPTAEELVAPPHTPQPIANRFIEAEDTFGRRRWTLAVAGYRSTLDIATKDIASKHSPSKATNKLADRVEALAAAHVITVSMCEWAHEVRGAGNEALHEEEEMTEEDAVQMRLLTKTFLQYAYEMPGEVAARKAQKKASP